MSDTTIETNLLDRIDALEAENATLRAELDAIEAVIPSQYFGSDERTVSVVSRMSDDLIDDTLTDVASCAAARDDRLREEGRRAGLEEAALVLDDRAKRAAELHEATTGWKEKMCWRWDHVRDALLFAAGDIRGLLNANGEEE